MPLVRCTDCQAEVSDRALTCPRCGGPINAATASAPTPKPVSSGAGPIFLAIGAAIVLAFIGWGVAVSSSPRAKEKAAARQVIDTCWEEQRRLSHAPDQARFIANTCEQAESSFRLRYGVDP